jgi:hypothetical protein
MKIKIPKTNKHLVTIPNTEWDFWGLQPGDTIEVKIVGAWNPDGTPKRAMSTQVRVA